MKLHTFLLLVFLAALAISQHSRAELRTWTDFRGKTIEAEFSGLSGNKVTLKNAEGKTMTIPLSTLSSADQVFINTQGKAKPVTSVRKQVAAEVPDNIKELFGSKIYNGKRKRSSTSILAGKKQIGLYFSASWCPPCRKFTPTLVDFYNDNKAAHPEFELILISSDYSKADMMDYMKKYEMPWLAIAPESKQAKALKKKFGSGGIPYLVIIDPDGNKISTNGRSEVRRGENAFKLWAKAP